ncbi:MAG: YeeE/YedE family protein [Bradyrhizobium sp.]|nr:YeeE/YedE family protein [Bradyrhizobium sp.]
MAVLLQFIIGLIFGFGLILSGMSNPAKVLNFLDIAAIRTGAWDASLAFVMAGAIAVTFAGYKLALRRSQPLFGERFHLPTKEDVDARVIAGPAVFGVGWGLAGFCPGPAITALGFGTGAAVIFVAAMLVGMWLARFIASRPSMSGIVTPADRVGA